MYEKDTFYIDYDLRAIGAFYAFAVTLFTSTTCPATAPLALRSAGLQRDAPTGELAHALAHVVVPEPQALQRVDMATRCRISDAPSHATSAVFTAKRAAVFMELGTACAAACAASPSKDPFSGTFLDKRSGRAQTACPSE